MVAFRFLAGIINQSIPHHLCRPHSTPKDLHVTTIFFATDVHGSGICWSRFLNQGKLYGTDRLVPGGDIVNKAVVPNTHQGGKDFRITLLAQVFETKNEEKLTYLVKRARSPGHSSMYTPKEIVELISENLTMPN